jgi:hypothetical protein
VGRIMDYREPHFKTYQEYYKQQSEYTRESIEYFSPLDQAIELPNGAYRETAIKIGFKDGNWIRAYYNGNNGEYEWY